MAGRCRALVRFLIDTEVAPCIRILARKFQHVFRGIAHINFFAFDFRPSIATSTIIPALCVIKRHGQKSVVMSERALADFCNAGRNYHVTSKTAIKKRIFTSLSRCQSHGILLHHTAQELRSNSPPTSQGLISKPCGLNHATSQCFTFKTTVFRGKTL